MRWQQLFDDLQSQFEAEEAALERVESASRARAEIGADSRGAQPWPPGTDLRPSLPGQRSLCAIGA